MYLVIKKQKLTPRAKEFSQVASSFTEYSALEAYILREGLSDIKIFKGEEVTFELKVKETSNVDE